MKCLKINLDLKDRENKSEIVFCFLDSFICIDCVKLFLLRRESSAVSVLTNSPKILHITKSDFFQLNSLRSDQ